MKISPELPGMDHAAVRGKLNQRKEITTMNRYAFLFFALLLCISAVTLQAQDHGRFGAGFILGEPTGISWKYHLDRTNSLDGALAVAPYDRFRMHVDYLWQSEPFNERNLSLYYGPGVAFGVGPTDYVVVNGRNAYFFSNRDVGLGIRGVLGLNYLIPRSPVDLFLEAAPIMVLVPNGGLGMDAGFGARFYF
jgi:hypothetical protein